MRSELETINGHSIPVIGLGTMKLEGKECKNTVREAIEVGYRHIDTAVIYENESAVGGAIKGIDREKLFITTKVWKDMLGFDDFKQSVEESLKRLGTSYIDLVLIHRPNSDIPLKKSAKAMNQLINEGKIRNIGVSNFDLSQLKDIQEMSEPPIITNQVKYHVGMDQSTLLQYCQKNGLLLTAYSPLARGKLVEEEILQDLGEKYEKTPGQIAIKWLIQKDNVITVPRATSKTHMKENLRLFDWKLEKKDMDELNSIHIET